MPPKRPKDHWSYGLEPGVPELEVVGLFCGGGSLFGSLFPLASFTSFSAAFASFGAPCAPGLKYFSKPFGGFSQKYFHWSKTRVIVDIF